MGLCGVSLTPPVSPGTRSVLSPKDQAHGDRPIAGRYRIVEPLARGGMGIVFRVVDNETGATLALKRMRKGNDPELLALFEREYRTLVALEHPRIIRVFDYGVDDDAPYYTMELIEGNDLYDLAPVDFKDACRYLRDVATCLSLLHARQLLHRDVTPRNVRVTPDGRCKLIDFGALTSFGIPRRAVGTPPFVPPEALHETPLDQRADIFSLGALAYWLVTRQHAYPARQLSDLPDCWAEGLVRPSKLNSALPAQADVLISRMLSPDPRVRPMSIAEVVNHLEVLGELPCEDGRTQQALAESYFQHTQFVGRAREMSALNADLRGLHGGASGRVRVIIGAEGLGRTRLLREAALQADLLGLRTVFVDGSGRHAASTALKALQQRSLVVGESLRAHQTRPSMRPPVLERERAAGESAAAADGLDVRRVFHEAFELACREGPLLLAIDNLELCDDASRALFASLPRACEGLPLAIVVSAATRDAVPATLLRAGEPLVLQPLTAAEHAQLARSIFGDAPHLMRTCEWLYERSDGRPLHSIEMMHQLFRRGQIRYEDGLWLLPTEQPEIELPASLEGLLSVRLAGLSKPARALAEAMAVQRRSVRRERALALADGEIDAPLEALDELVDARVVAEDSEGYRFCHGALAELLRAGTDEGRKRALHRRCAVLELERAAAGNSVQAQVEAGWHLLEAGDDEQGADLLAELAFGTVGLRLMLADAMALAPTFEVALKIYERLGRSLTERMPLLAALAHAGYYEDLRWAERYGDEALLAVEEVTGLNLARKLRPWLGQSLSLACALAVAAVRLRFRLRNRRRYGIKETLVSLFGVVTCLTGCAAMTLNPERAAALARRLEMFRHLPARLTPVGIAEFCESLAELSRDTPSLAVGKWDQLLSRFRNKRYYPTLPDDARPLYVGGLLFAKGALCSFKDSPEALEAADALDQLGLRLYSMVASQIRVLYYTNRGAMTEAEHHRRELEMYAIQIGSASQVEIWSPAAMLVPYGIFGDMLAARRMADRLSSLSDAHPHLRMYAHLAIAAYEGARALQVPSSGDERSRLLDIRDGLTSIVGERPPRDFIGWGATLGICANVLNWSGLHAEALWHANYALEHIPPEDLRYTTLYLGCELEHAVAIAALGDVAAGRRELEELLARCRDSDNPITHGRIHEAFARIAAVAKDWPVHAHHTAQTRKWFQQVEVPALIARVDALEALRPGTSARPPRRGASEESAVTVHRAPRRITGGACTDTGVHTESELTRTDSVTGQPIAAEHPQDITMPEYRGSEP